jgi:hypothetical protein
MTYASPDDYRPGDDIPEADEPTELDLVYQDLHRMKAERDKLRAVLEAVRSSGANSHRQRMATSRYGDVTIAGAAYDAVLAALSIATPEV